jgi:hypothetical protein
MQNDPYYFPFDIVNQNELITGDNYYMKLNTNIIKNFVDKRRNIPVSDLKGVFIRLDKEVDIANNVTIEYAVFKNVYIMNKQYKKALCNFMLVRYPDGILASDDCDSYSDNFKNRLVNDDREVFLAVNRWQFGIPTQEKIITQKALEKIQPKINDSLTREVLKFRGTLGGKKNRKIKIKRTKRNKRTKRLRKNKTKKIL